MTIFALWYASGWALGVYCMLYVLLLLTIGLFSWRKGNTLWFVLGFFIPLCWVVGAILPDRRRR